MFRVFVILLMFHVFMILLSIVFLWVLLTAVLYSAVRGAGLSRGLVS